MTVSNDTFVQRFASDTDTDFYRTKHAGRHSQGLVNVSGCDDQEDQHKDLKFTLSSLLSMIPGKFSHEKHQDPGAGAGYGCLMEMTAQQAR